MDACSQGRCETPETHSHGDGRREVSGEQHGCSSCVVASAYRLFNRQRSIHQIMGGGKAADVILWKRCQISFAVIVVATVAWLAVEWSGLPFLSISADVPLILVVVQFIRSNSASLLNKQVQPLPELILSEEMVNNAAALVRVKINNMLLVAHDITLGKDFRLFIKVVICLWLLSIIGSFFSFFTILYIGIIISITVPALYNKYEVHVDKYAGLVHQKISKQFKVVDESVIRRLPKRFATDKDA